MWHTYDWHRQYIMFSVPLAVAVLLQPNLFSKNKSIFLEEQLQTAGKQYNLNATALRHKLVGL